MLVHRLNSRVKFDRFEAEKKILLRLLFFSIFIFRSRQRVTLKKKKKEKRDIFR